LRLDLEIIATAEFRVCGFYPHYPTFLFASPNRKVAKEKGDFLPTAPLAKK
jgi:hypothetical protein